MHRNTAKDIQMALAGIVAGAFLTMSAADTVKTHSAIAAEAGGVDMTLHVTEILGVDLDNPANGDNRALGVVLKVFADITGLDKEDDKEE